MGPQTMSNPTPESDANASNSFTSGKFLTFLLAEESYGIEVLLIREIIRMQTITPVPHMPAHVKGVINLRGKVIPVVDLRLKVKDGVKTLLNIEKVVSTEIADESIA